MPEPADPNLCSDPIKHGPHPWGYRHGKPIQCPGLDVFLGPSPSSRTRSEKDRARDREAWLMQHVGVRASQWGRVVPHSHVLADPGEASSGPADPVRLKCLYIACNYSLEVYGDIQEAHQGAHL